MKLCRKIYLAFALMLISTLPAICQEADAVTDDELMKYAVLMDSVNSMKEMLMTDITNMVQNNEKITASRYNELSKIIDDTEKLTAANATADEIAAVKAVAEKKDEETAKINETFQGLAKDYVGASTYNKVRKALQSNPEVKAKYETMLKGLSEKEKKGDS